MGHVYEPTKGLPGRPQSVYIQTNHTFVFRESSSTDYFNLFLPFRSHSELLIDGETDKSYTYTDLKHLSCTFGAGLRHLYAWRKGDVLAFYTPNSIDTPVVNLGLHWAGGVASPANPTYTVDELSRQLQDSRAKALITQAPFLDLACAAADKAGLPRDRILLLGEERRDRFVHWTDVTAKGAWIQPGKVKIDPKNDLAYLVYSSVRILFLSLFPFFFLATLMYGRPSLTDSLF